MGATAPARQRGKLRIWAQAVRAFSFTASIIPVALGAALAASSGQPIAWPLLPLVVACALLYHAGTNLVSDYFDHCRGVDRDYTFGSSRVIVEGLLAPADVLRAGLLAFAVGIGLGLVLVAVRGAPMLALGAAGLVGGFFYCGAPIGYKYRALGDPLVFLLMGPLMVIGSYYALTGTYSSTVLWASLPIGFLVTAILHANNLRDIVHDSDAGVITIAGVMGHKLAKLQYYGLLAAAYLSVGVMVARGTLPAWALAVFLSLPPAIQNLRTIAASRADAPQEVALIDVKTAQHHFLFGLLLTLSITGAAIL
jgi:1,4-dihydroxy-2-naphthoate octaprenyltransferase